MKIKTIETNGITYIEPVPGATNEWYYGMDYEHGDLYEAEELINNGYTVNGREFCLIHYPDGEVFFPVPKTQGHYSEKLFFNRWFEEGEGVDYKYWEETIVRDLNGNVIEMLIGDVMQMPNGEIWHLK